MTEPFGVSAAHTSVPKPQRLTPAPHARLHVIVTGDYGPTIEQLIAEIRGRHAAATISLISADAAALRAAASGHVELCQESALAQALALALAHAHVGTHLYATGDHDLIARLTAAAKAAGLEASEITALVNDHTSRVFCVHCKTTTSTHAREFTPCSGCGRTLVIYHHFSRRHSAYMGYQTDAEAPVEPELVAG